MPQVSRETKIRQELATVPKGWTPEGWAGELHRKAGLCASIQPVLAVLMRQAAGDVQNRYGINVYESEMTV